MLLLHGIKVIRKLKSDQDIDFLDTVVVYKKIGDISIGE